MGQAHQAILWKNEHTPAHFSLCSAKSDNNSIRIKHDNHMIIKNNVSAISANSANTFVGQAKLDDRYTLKHIPN